MARISVFVTVIFLLFTLSHAHTPLDLTDHDRVPSISVPASDDIKTTTILLPSEKPDTEPNTVVEFEPEVTSSEIEPETMLAEPDLIRPLTIVSIRPINRHFPNIHGGDRRSPHRCHHHHQHRREISYGNDMLLANEDHHDDVMKGDDSTMFHEEFHHHRDHHNLQYGGEVSLLNDMLVANEDGTASVVDEDPTMFHEEFHHHRDHHHESSKFPIRHEDDTMMKMKRPFFFHHHMHHDHDHRHHHHHHHHHMEEVEDVKHEEGFGFWKRVRKFLNHF